MTIELGTFGIWSFAFDQQPASAAQDLAAQIEALGYGSIWIPEAVGRDPLVSASMLLSGTSTITVATGIASIYARDPMSMSQGHKTVSEWFPGRFLLGLGVSHAPMVEGMRGHVYGPPLAAMRSYLDTMDGALFMAAQPTTPPQRVLAALGPKMLALAAERAAGAHPYNVTPVHTEMARKVLGDGPFLVPDQKVVLCSDASVARAVGRASIKIYLGLPNYVNNFFRQGFTEDDLRDGGSDRFVDALFAWGTADQIAARLREHVDAGADHVAINVQTTGPEQTHLSVWQELAPALGLG